VPSIAELVEVGVKDGRINGISAGLIIVTAVGGITVCLPDMISEMRITKNSCLLTDIKCFVVIKS
jgi:enoyl-[acyl-carrier-protein] reductase (NADH)